MLEVGRICVKTAGREAGKFCVVIDMLDDKFVLVTGPRVVTKVKRRKCNVEHLEPTPEVIKVKKNASDDEVISAYKHDGVFGKLEAKPPSAHDIQVAKEKERKRAVMAKEAAKKKPEKPAEPEKKEEHKQAEKKHKEKKEKHKEKKPEKKPEKKHKEHKEKKKEKSDKKASKKKK